MIIYNTLDVKFPKIKRRIVSNWIKYVTGNFNKRVGDISFIFCSDEKILELNKEYLSHNYYTDVLTFDYSKNEIISGDIFISIDTVTSNAKNYQIPLTQELYHVMIHGILHLCGMNDNNKKTIIDMRKSEKEAMDYLNFLLK